VSNTTQTGSYYGEDAVSHDAFTLYLDHGVTPVDAGYEYIVLPAATATETEAYAAKPAVTVLRNDTTVQAVRHPGLKRTMATFYRAGSLDLGDGRTLTVSQPSIVMLDESGAAPVVSISNPSQPALLVDVTLAGGGADARGTFVLGSGANLGKTVTAVLAADDSAGSPYTASGSASGHGPSLAGDADQATFWRSAGDLPWLQKQLTTGSFATGVEIDWGAEFATRYLVQTSTDGTSWTDQKLVQNGAGGHESVEFPATAANFVRVILLDGAGPYTVRELAVTASVNLALGAPTTASDGTGPDSATDGNLTTRWIADRTGSPDTSWLQVDLGSVQQIDAVRLSWEASYASKYKIQVSDDGSSWSDIYTTPSAGSDGGTDLVSVDATGRYVRMQTVARALSSYGVSLWEFEVFGGGAIVDAPVASGRVNLALGQPTTADSVYNNLTNIVPTMATDGSLTTKWSSNRPSGTPPYAVENWLQVDLGTVQAVSQALVDWESSNSHDYRVEGSVDGSSWTELAHVQNTGTGNHRRDVVDFATAHIRYLRVIGTPATKYGLNIWELEVYGGYSLVCSALVSLEHAGSAVLTATISPADADDTFTATSLSPGIASVVGGPRVTGGQIEFDLAAGAAGATAVIVTHGNGDEFVSCPVTVAVDKAELHQLVDQADGLDSTRYTSRSWAPLIPALQSAKAALTSSDATQADVDAAAAGLRAAIGGLAEPGTPTLQVTGTPVVGGKITVLGVAFDPGTVVTVELHSDPVELGTVTVDGTGAFSLTATIPADTDPGEHEIVVLGGGVELATFALTISPAASDGGPGTTPADDDPLAGTGTDPVAMGTGLALALLLLVGGAAAVMLRRRRHMEG
jgi:chondroitin AC lyase